MKKELENRGYLFEIRAEHNEKHGDYIEGRPIVYDKPTDIGGMFEETICAGALDKTDLEDVRFLVNHDVNKIPLARSRRNNENSTMQLVIDKQGLSIRVNLDTENNAEAKALYSAVKRGDITGMSFLFKVEEERWEDLDKDYPKRFVIAISTVIEVSAVTFPAYKDTEITARNKEALDNAKKAVETARAGTGTLESERQQDKRQLELWKEKNKILGGF